MVVKCLLQDQWPYLHYFALIDLKNITVKEKARKVQNVTGQLLFSSMTANLLGL
jgi:hypothetical protein